MQDSQIVRMELKYCECCGGLLLRPAGTEIIYCAGCAAHVRELAPPRARRRRERGPTLPQAEARGTCCETVDEIHAVAASSRRKEAGQVPGTSLPFCGDAGRPVESAGYGEHETWRTA
jgi:hypothetical protein